MSIEIEEKVIRRKKRMSKKTKKGWRKGSDIADVETFLEKTRGDERKGYFMSSVCHVLSDNKFLRSNYYCVFTISRFKYA